MSSTNSYKYQVVVSYCALQHSLQGTAQEHTARRMLCQGCRRISKNTAHNSYELRTHTHIHTRARTHRHTCPQLHGESVLCNITYSKQLGSHKDACAVAAIVRSGLQGRNIAHKPQAYGGHCLQNNGRALGQRAGCEVTDMHQAAIARHSSMSTAAARVQNTITLRLFFCPLGWRWTAADVPAAHRQSWPHRG